MMAEAPELIVMDIRMPGMNGFDVCRKIKELDQLKDIPVIFISAASDMEDKVRAFEEGGVDYITKPFHKEEVIARVKTHIALSQTIQRMKEIAEALQKSEESLKFAQTVAHLGHWELNVKSGQFICSEEMYRILGIDAQGPMANQNVFLQTVHPDDRERVASHLNEVLAGSSFDMEYRVILQNGKVRVVHGKGEVFCVSDGRQTKIIGTIQEVAEGDNSKMLGVVQDITDRKIAEEVVQKSEANLRAIMDNSPYLTWLKDAEGRYITVNKAFVDYLHLQGVQQAVGKTDMEVHPKELAEKYRADDVEVMSSRQQKHFEESGFDGKQIHWVETFKTPIIDVHGNVLGTVGFAQDITERKKVEQELRIAATAFETHDAILITDAHANIIRVNQAFTDITGYSAEEVQGKNPRIMSSGRQDRTFYVEMWQELLHNGSWSGEIWDKRKNGNVYPKWLTITAVKNERQEITNYVANFSDISERKQAEEEIRNLAFYDTLTRLPNRRLFLDRFRSALASSARREEYGAILFIDLDRFKVLNDTLGHDYGDLLLIEVGVRIKSCVREMDTVARFGGDEFVVLIETISNDKNEATSRVALVGEKIRNALAQPYKLKDHEHHSSPSIGISLYCGHEETMEALIEHADMAMYQVKNSGRNAVRFFDPVMQQSMAKHDALENDLHYAIELKQLQLHYQIQVDRNNLPLGAEAFLRWIHPERGTILPGKFLPIAENSNLIIELGHWVLQTACHQLALWGKDEKTRELTLTVNISAKHFGKPDFVSELSDILNASRANPKKLKLELSERLVMADMKDTNDKVQALRNLGVRLSMDNFSTVYSSLSFLQNLSSDQLKIHQEFVQGISHNGNDAQLIRAVIDRAKSLDLDVFAEGVETDEQR
jgi:diguanylate cyclase (GGDEF)-like protein/PAS domain S-box-containing protein